MEGVAEYGGVAQTGALPGSRPGRRVLPVLLFLAAWEAVPRVGIADPLFLPPLSRVLEAAWEQAAYGGLVRHAGISLFRAAAGFLVGAAAAIPLGFLLGGWFRKAEVALSPLLDLLSQANPFLLFHVILLFLGIGEATKVAIIAWACVWPVLFGTIAAVRGVDPVLLRTARAFGLGRRALFLRVVLPGAAPSVFASLRLSLGQAFLMLIAAEMMGASSGLGWLVLGYQETYHPPRIFAAASAIAVLGLSLDAAMRGIERKLFIRRNLSCPWTTRVAN